MSAGFLCPWSEELNSLSQGGYTVAHLCRSTESFWSDQVCTDYNGGQSSRSKMFFFVCANQTSLWEVSSSRRADHWFKAIRSGRCSMDQPISSTSPSLFFSKCVFLSHFQSCLFILLFSIVFPLCCLNNQATEDEENLLKGYLSISEVGLLVYDFLHMAIDSVQDFFIALVWPFSDVYSGTTQHIVSLCKSAVCLRP